jgi:small subunit ribosomal protein S6
MRTYEHIFIVHPDVAGEEYAAVLDKFKGILAEQGASVLKIEEWGSRKLAYPVKKQGRGTYVLMVFEGGAGVVAEFERRLRLDEKIIKFQTVLLPKGIEAAAPAEQAAASADEAAASADEAAASGETAEQGE